MNLGAHLSVSGGLYTVFERAQATGAYQIQLFTKPASRWEGKEISDEDIDLFKVGRKTFESSKKRKKTDPPLTITSHGAYLINLASPKPELIEKSINAMIEEISRADAYGLDHLVLHPGSHMKEGETKGIKKVGDSFIKILNTVGDEPKVRILLETTAGQGSNLGYRFEHLRDILDRIDGKFKSEKYFGICYDTCHSFSAGYDLRSKDEHKKTFKEFNTIIGLDKLKLFHLNDSMHEFAQKKDRHTNIGEGHIGKAGFQNILNDQKLKKIPMVLETPKGEDEFSMDIKNLKYLRKLRNKD